MISPALYLIPVPISDAAATACIPADVVALTRDIRDFVVENVRTARRMLKRFDRDFPIGECMFTELSEHTAPEEIPAMLAPLREGRPVGLMSEAGCPAVADPGASLVAAAQAAALPVRPLVGPSSILLALMGSGFNGQGFTFHGYLPVDASARIRTLKDLEADSRRTGRTQIFIETPYRNDRFLKSLTETLHPSTMLCVAADVTSPETEYLVTRSVASWRRSLPEIGKRPAIFLISASGQNPHSKTGR